MTSRSVLVCDDHPIFRKGVVNIIAEIEGFHVIAEANDVDSAVAKLQIYSPDILVTDISLPRQSGFVLLEWARTHMPRVRVVVLSMHSDLAFVEKARTLDAIAYIAKEDATSELYAALASDAEAFYTSQSAGSANLAGSAAQAPTRLTLNLAGVSPAELRVLVLLSRSMTSRQIASQLNISPRTVETHRRNLAEKLQAKGPNKLLELAIRLGEQLRNS